MPVTAPGITWQKIVLTGRVSFAIRWMSRIVLISIESAAGGRERD
jgi:hypothetical protein